MKHQMAAVGFSLFFSSATFAADYEIKDVGDITLSSYIYDMNDNGQIVGAAVKTFLWESIYFDGSNLRTLHEGDGTGPNAASGLLAINNDGMIIGKSFGHTGIGSGMFTLKNSEVTWVDTDTRSGLGLAKINDNGDMMVSFAYSGEGRPRGGVTLFFNGNEATEIGPYTETPDYLVNPDVAGLDMNEDGDIVGAIVESHPVGGIFQFNERAFIIRGGIFTDLGTFGAANASASGINKAGQILVNTRDSQRDSDKPLLIDGDVVKDLGIYQDFSTQVASINNSGEIVGRSVDEVIYPDDGTSRYEFYTGEALVYRDGKWINLETLLPSNSGWDLRTAVSVNNKGQIAGIGYLNGARKIFLLTPTSQQ